MQPDADQEQSTILLNMKPETYDTFICYGCKGGVVRKMEDKRPRLVEGKGGRVTKVTRCIYCFDKVSPDVLVSGMAATGN